MSWVYYLLLICQKNEPLIFNGVKDMTVYIKSGGVLRCL